MFVAKEARGALAALIERRALVSVESRSAGHLPGDRLVPNLTIVSRDEVTTALKAEIATILADAGITSPFLVSRAVPWTPKSTR
jgi:hypothetical protein